MLREASFEEEEEEEEEEGEKEVEEVCSQIFSPASPVNNSSVGYFNFSNSI